MTNQKVIVLEDWPRRRQYEFFSRYDNPFYNITSNLDVTQLLAHTRKQGYSFFAAYIFASQKALNAVPEFRVRIAGDRLVEFASVHPSSTVLQENEQFTFCYFEQANNFIEFQAQVRNRIADCKKRDHVLNPQDEQLDQIHYSVLPWIHFTGVSHPRFINSADSIPKIVFGQYRQEQDTMVMPVSVEVHHGLVDGLHVGRYLSGFQGLIQNPSELLEA